MTPLVSVIIPCYNSGRYLSEAIESVLTNRNKNLYEIIIVNDGSTEVFTLSLLKKLSGEGYTIIDQENMGTGAARNTGVKHSKGEYILFLDSDNKIRSDYIDKGIKILQKHNDVGVVYGNASFFGESDKPRFITREFDRHAVLANNYIDICSVVRKKAWEEVGGFDENRMIMAHADWEFWIHLISKGWKFHYINQVLFDYRIREDSLLIQQSGDDSIRQIVNYIHSKHWHLFFDNYRQVYACLTFYGNDKKKPLRSFIKYLHNKYFIKKGNPVNQDH